MKLLLVCSGGISTSILMRKLSNYAAENGIENFEVEAHGFNGFLDIVDEFDCVLAGPQIGYRIDDIKAAGKPCDVISPDDYGSANCKNVFEQIDRIMAEAKESTDASISPTVTVASDHVAEAPESALSEEPANKTVFEKLFDSAPMKMLQNFGASMRSNKVIQSVTSGMMCTMSLIMVGAIFTIVASVLHTVGVLTTDSTIYQQLMIPYNMTMGLMSVAVAFAVGYIYTKNLGMRGELANGIVTLVLFLMVSAPFKEVALADGTTMTAMDTSMLGGTGLFTALILPIISVRIIKLCQDKNVSIKMPDSIPPFLSDSFTALIPLFFNVILWRGLGFVCETFMGASLPSLVMGLLGLPLSALTSGPGIIVLALIGQIMWCFGMHGNGIVYIALMAPMMQAMSLNAELYAAGQPTVFSTTFLFAVFACCGGAGNCLPLAIRFMRAKSEKLKAVGKASVIPAAFNIMEPIVFGTPIVFNPILDIPFVLNGVVSALIVWFGYSVGFFVPPHIMIMSVLPVGLGDFLGSLAWQNLLIPVVGFVVGYLMYAPFVRMYDKQCLAEEADRSEEKTVQA